MSEYAIFLRGLAQQWRPCKKAGREGLAVPLQKTPSPLSALWAFINPLHNKIVCKPLVVTLRC